MIILESQSVYMCVWVCFKYMMNIRHGLVQEHARAQQHLRVRQHVGVGQNVRAIGTMLVLPQWYGGQPASESRRSSPSLVHTNMLLGTRACCRIDHGYKYNTQNEYINMITPESQSVYIYIYIYVRERVSDRWWIKVMVLFKNMPVFNNIFVFGNISVLDNMFVLSTRCSRSPNDMAAKSASESWRSSPSLVNTNMLLRTRTCCRIDHGYK